MSKEEKSRLKALENEEQITQEDILENIKIAIGGWFGKIKIELSEENFESSYSSSEEESSDYSAMAARRRNYREKRKPGHLENKKKDTSPVRGDVSGRTHKSMARGQNESPKNSPKNRGDMTTKTNKTMKKGDMTAKTNKSNRFEMSSFKNIDLKSIKK